MATEEWNDEDIAATLFGNTKKVLVSANTLEEITLRNVSPLSNELFLFFLFFSGSKVGFKTKEFFVDQLRIIELNYFCLFCVEQLSFFLTFRQN